jgi:diaminopimelate epimerase
MPGMKLAFTKMHGAGNDFVVIDATHQPFALENAQIRTLAHRHTGVGFDQLLVVEPARTASADFRYRIFNADGSEVAQCGNGARCFMRFVHERGLTEKREIRVETASGVISPRLESDGRVTVDMGLPRLAPADIPFLEPVAALRYMRQTGAGLLEFAALSMGNPHAVIAVPDVELAQVARLGPALQAHPDFPHGVNVGFLQVIDRRHARLRVYERGAGETLSCGSGACAALVAGRRWGLLDATVNIATHGGDLTLHWDGEGGSVLLTGPAATVFSGELEL